ncbi:MAG: ferrous iron transport protein A [Solobacterium sp.]|nr:ferrous iron transport protein A [Solobacterium sp.]MBQ6356161.1 ferrous iron transport protein A [Solobacterium sp.]MBR0214328.1 ferrous iron transport protein A [Solobacterium sp.]
MTLNEVPPSADCRIIWMLSPLARKVGSFCRFAEEDHIRVVANTGSGVIIESGGHRYILGAEAAEAIRVEF